MNGGKIKGKRSDVAPRCQISSSRKTDNEYCRHRIQALHSLLILVCAFPKREKKWGKIFFFLILCRIKNNGAIFSTVKLLSIFFFTSMLYK
jgi:hypothetical protein